MAYPSSCRAVRLIDARDPGRGIVTASIYRDYPPVMLDVIETSWASARDRAAAEAAVSGLASVEHSLGLAKQSS